MVFPIVMLVNPHIKITALHLLVSPKMSSLTNQMAVKSKKHSSQRLWWGEGKKNTGENQTENQDKHKQAQGENYTD